MAAKKQDKPSVDRSRAITAPSVRTFTEWTPTRLRTAERQSEQGDLSYAVGVCEFILTDDRVSGLLQTRCEALLGLDPTFEAGRGRRAKLATRALEADDDWFDSYPESELKQLMTWGILLGVAPARHNWVERADHGGRLLPMPSFWHPQHLRFDFTKRQWSVRASDNTEHVVTPGDGEWILHTPYGASRPWAHGLWRSLGRWVLLKYYAMTDWARHSEKAALMVATAPIGSTKEQRRELAQDLSAIGSDAAIALAAGFDLKIVEIAANTKQIYEAQIALADLAIAIRIRGGNLTTNVEGGSRAAAETQQKSGDGVKLKSDALALGTTIQSQSLKPWALYNYGDANLAPWPVWPVEPEEDKNQRATMVKTLGEGLTVFDKLGFDVDPKIVKEEFGLTFLTGRTREREPDPVPPAPGAPADDKTTKKKTSARAVLSSGAARAEVSGFVDGQAYADELVEAGALAGGALLEQDLNRILALVDSVKSLGELEAKLGELYQDLDPERLSETVERFMVVADIAGRAAVMQDL
jgi:phage gp29-like protein